MSSEPSMLPWFTKFNGVVPDERWIEPVASPSASDPSARTRARLPFGDTRIAPG